MPLKVTFTLSDKDLSHFRRHMKQARATASEMGEDSIIRAAEGLLEEVSDVELPDFIAERLQRLEVLVDILRDERWDMPAADRGRVLSGLAYFTDPNDMIPDQIPGIGYLDDAIMVELIVREFLHDIEGYEDFCAAEGPLQKATRGTPEDQRRLQERRVRLQRRVRRRNRASRERSRQRGHRVSLW
jgi:uncharacterized membrane protein YkvA (DUF1232 family)